MTLLQRNNIGHVVAAMACMVCLALVWIPAIFVTGDGACHVYNAHILNDVWQGKHAAFYNGYYTPNLEPNPNWTSHLLLAGLMYFFNSITSEKILLSVYVLLSAGGLYQLLRRLNPKASYWALSVFLLVFHHTLLKGFYNFSLATALLPWLVVAWLAVLRKGALPQLFAFFIVSAITFFTQLLPYAVGVAICIFLTFSYQSAAQPGTNSVFTKQLFKKWIVLGLLSGPFVYLLFSFTHKQGGLGLSLHGHPYRLVELITLKYLINFTSTERYFTSLAGITIAVLSGVAIVNRIKSGWKLFRFDGLWLALIAAMLVYLFFPEDFMGRAILITMRMQLIVLVLLCCCISVYVPYATQNAGGWILLCCFVCLSVVRFPVSMAASRLATDVMATATFIKPRSTVLPLLFQPNGINGQHPKVIANSNYIFSHVADYLASKQPLIMLDNYEAHTGYFPFNWKPDKNPYAYLSAGKGVEGLPPCADITAYKHNTGVEVDYILLIGLDTQKTERRPCAALCGQIQHGYSPCKVVDGGNIILMVRNTKP